MPDKRKTHGLTALKRVVSARGIDALDGRTVAVRAVMAWRTALLNDLGGEANVSTQKLAIVDACVRGKLFLDHIDSYLMQEPSLVNRRRKSLIPALRERQSLCDGLSRLLQQLGLERQQKPIKSLQEHLREMEAAKAAETKEEQSS